MVATMEPALKDLQQIPGVGKELSRMFWSIGIHSVRDLDGGNPDELYQKICDFKGTRVDRCVLYVLRCAVYYASNQKHSAELLKWWNWKDC